MIKVKTGDFFDGRYEILAELGKGGMGEVFLARQLDGNRIVALKLLAWSDCIDENSRKRFLREFKILSNIQDPHIMTFYHMSISHSGMLYAACEYIKGKTLRTIADQEGVIPWKRILHICIQICEAMAVAHQIGVVHRDLKPANIMLLENSPSATGALSEDSNDKAALDKQSEPGTDFVKIIDFGLSNIAELEEAKSQKLTFTGQLLGSVHYMSPEQAAGEKVDQRSDIYSLACVVFEMLSGERLFDGDNPVGILALHQRSDQITRMKIIQDSVPPEFIRILLRMLEKKPAKRYASMLELKEDLDRLAQNDLLQTVTPALRSNKLLRNWKPAAILVSILTLLAAACVCVNQNSLNRLNGSKQDKSQKDTAKKMIVFYGSSGSRGLTRLQELAQVQATKQDYKSAIETYKKILSIQKSRAVVDEVEIANTMQQLASAYLLTKDHEHALNAYLEAKKLLSKRLSPNHGTIIGIEIAIGKVYTGMEMHEKAEPVLEMVLEKQKRQFGLQSLQATFAIDALFTCYLHQNKIKEAERLLNSRLKLKAVPEDPAQYIASQTILARCLNDIDSFLEAEAILNDCHKVSKEMKIQESDPDLERGLNLELIRSLLGQVKLQEAEQTFARFLDLIERLKAQHKNAYPELDPPNLFVNFSNDTAKRFVQKKNYKDAERLCLYSLAHLKKRGMAKSPQAVQAGTQLACIYRDTKRYNEAESLFKSLASLAEELGEPEETATQLGNLATVYALAGKWKDAEATNKQAIAISTKAEPLELATEYLKLARFYDEQSRKSESRAILELAKKSIESDKTASDREKSELLQSIASLNR